MIKKLKHKKKVLIPDVLENHESIKAADLDVSKKIIYSSIKYYLKEYKQKPDYGTLAIICKLLDKMANSHGMSLESEEVYKLTRRVEFKKNIIELKERI